MKWLLKIQSYEILENSTVFQWKEDQTPWKPFVWNPCWNRDHLQKVRYRLLLKRNTPTKGMQKGIGWSLRWGHTQFRTAVKYKSQAIWFWFQVKRLRSFSNHPAALSTCLRPWTKATWSNDPDPDNGSDMRKVLYALERSNFIRKLITKPKQYP